MSVPYKVSPGTSDARGDLFLSMEMRKWRRLMMIHEEKEEKLAGDQGKRRAGNGKEWLSL
ncbi:MAG: hypothetical protein C4520_14795 [Candidatus Abyssobacteria bacterium SURF_5]|uniref:Uncharacterized protein n=1 Tax=Abyssobacteria bacterium (strain SURF_5) TaxID=2093360 RepID=A0A3A4NR41_ABYX5|nr:MAG: hypothetical protein C4520_14795 [Candidatus Abyssubacteria bacterium SURF_5]